VAKKLPFQYFKLPKNIDKSLVDLKTKPPSYWENKGKDNALKLFDFVVRKVPAYERFLKRHKINRNKIKSIEDFRTLPISSKENYLRRSNFIDLLPNRDISDTKTFSATSGSTGEPFYFPRGDEQDWQYEYIAEMFLKNQFEIDKKTTLGIIGFGIGIWIGGIFTYKNFNKIASKGYQLALAPVGNTAEIYLDIVKKFGNLFDQVILMGYAPFVKDIIDEAKDYGINWRDYNLRILTAAEGYSEKFKKYVAKKASLKDPLMDFVNIYGTVELGTMAHETPLSNLIRLIAVENKTVFRAIFPKANRLPTLVQYYPQIIYFEEEEDEVIATGYGSSIPLVRYRFPDIGGVITYDDMISKLKDSGVDILIEAKKNKIDKNILHLPFVYVYDRSDHALILRGANIYPEEIKNALQDKLLDSYVTGKFSMEKKEDRKMDEYLEINVELKKRVKKSKKLEKLIEVMITDFLKKENSEFSYLYSLDSDKLIPGVVLWPYGHEKHFSPKGKQKWVIKNEK